MNYKTYITKKDLVVVIGCIVFLVMTVGAVNSNDSMRAKNAVCMSHFYQQGIMFNAFAVDNDGNFPQHDNAGSCYVKSAGGTDMTLLLEGYASKPELFYCPLDPTGISIDYGTPPYDYASWKYRNEPGNQYVIISYAWYANFGAPGFRYYNGHKPASNMGEANSSHALGSDMLFILWPWVPDQTGRTALDFEFRKEDYAGEQWYNTGVWMGHPWGGGGINVLGSDGSVEKHRWAETKVRYDYGHLNYDVVYY